MYNLVVPTHSEREFINKRPNKYSVTSKYHVMGVGETYKLASTS